MIEKDSNGKVRGFVAGCGWESVRRLAITQEDKESLEALFTLAFRPNQFSCALRWVPLARDDGLGGHVIPVRILQLVGIINLRRSWLFEGWRA